MKTHHKWFHSYDTIRKRNDIFRMIRDIIFMLKNQDSSGESLGMTVEEIKASIIGRALRLPTLFGHIDKFIRNHERFDMMEFSDKTQDEVLLEKLPIEDLSSRIQSLINKVSVNTLEKLASISVTNPIEASTPLQMYPLMQYTGILNDLLDASSYVLRGINPNDGTILSVSDDEKKKVVRGYLDQFSNFIGFQYPLELQPEVNLMVNVRNSVMADLDIKPLVDIADYIDANVAKLPLIRRNWAIGG